VAVASAGPNANMHLTQTDNHASIPSLSFYRPDALPAAQQTASKHYNYLSEMSYISVVRKAT